MSAFPATLQLAHVALTLDGQLIDKSDLRRAKLCLLDWLGVTVCGSMTESVKAVRTVLTAEGGNDCASFIGSGGKGTVRQAALLNSMASHIHDYDDVHLAIPGHPTAPVAGAVWALAEARNFSGLQALEALIAGIEVMCRLGRALSPGHYANGWHASSTLGVIGAAAASARLISLSRIQTAAALGLASSMASGLRGSFGSPAKPFQIGHAAASGVLAAEITERQIIAHTDVLERTDGFFETFGRSSTRPDLLAVADELAINGVQFKRHAACFLVHAAIEAAIQLVNDQVRLDNIEQIVVRGNEDMIAVCNRPQLSNALDTKFSVQFAVAATLCGYETASLALFDAPPVSDSSVASLMSRIRVERSSELGQDDAILFVRMRDGPVIERSAHVGSGLPLEEEEQSIRAKVRSLWDDLIEPAEINHMIDKVLLLDEQIELPDIAVLNALKPD